MTRSGWRRLSLALLAAVAGLVCALSLTGPASAEPNQVLVSTDYASGGTRNIASFDQGQAFTTGPHAAGYRLTTVAVDLTSTVVTDPTYAVKICTGTDSAPCTAEVGTLTNPASLVTGRNEFTASGGGIDLSHSTTYYFVFDVTAAGTGVHNMFHTTSDGEVADRASGWSIANNSVGKQFDVTSWSTNANTLQIELIGRAKESTAPTPQSYEISGSKLIITYDRELDTTAPAAGQFRVKVGSAATADASAVAISGNRVTLTTATAAASGDTVQTRYIKPTSGNKLQDIDGNEVANQTSMQAVTNHTGDTTPELESAAVDANIVTLTFDRSLNEASIPGESSLWLRHPRVTLACTADSIVVQGRQVVCGTLTLSVLGAARAGETVQVRYAKPAANKLQDAWGNDVSAFGLDDQTVTNDSPLVKNTYRIDSDRVADSSDAMDRDQAQAFTTGSNAGGYTLTSVEVMLTGGSGTATPTYTVTIHDAGANNVPGTTTVGTLTKPSALKRGLNRFTAPGSGIDLDANTTYVLHIDVTGAVDAQYVYYSTASLHEDPGNSPGWTIANGRSTRPHGGGNWEATGASFLMVLRGALKADPSDVANTGQTQATGTLTIGTAGAKDWSHALAFTTGSDPTTLTEVDARLKTVPTTAGVQVSVWSTTGANKLPDSKLYTLTNPTLAADSLNTFTAPAGSTLDASTTYAVVFENTAPANQYELATTDSNNEDSGGTSGWSIADKGAHKGGTDAWAVNSGAGKAQIAVRATVRVIPAPAAPSGLAATSQANDTANQIVLTWTDPSDSSITKYQTRQRADDASSWSAWADVSGSGATTTTATVSGLTTRKRYTVELRAVNASGDGASAAVTWGAHAALVNNLSQGGAVTGLDINTNDGAQPFTTGSHAGGYTLTSVVAAMTPDSGATAPTYSVKICNDSVGAPGATCTTLTNPTSLANGPNWFTSASGVQLTASTTYWMVLDSASGGSGALRFRRTSSNAEDSDGLSDWSLGNSGLSRARATTNWAATNNNAYGLAVFGFLKTGPSAPTGLAAAAGNAQLSLSWSDPSNAGINKYQYRVSSDGGTSWSPDWTDIAGSSASTTSHTVTGLQNGTTYTVEVRAVGDSGNTPGASASTTGTPTTGDTTAPTVTSATVAANGTTMTVQLSETGLKGALDVDDWTYTVANANRGNPTGGWNPTTGTITFTLSPAVLQGQTVRLSFNGGSGTNKILDQADNPLAAFSNRQVTNNSTQQAQQNAQTSDTLVSNTGQGDGPTGNFNNDHAQAFTTGGHAHGYRVTSISVKLVVTGSHTDWDAELWSSSGSEPGESIGTLTKPGSISSGLNTFTASGAGIKLSANTTYWVVVNNHAAKGNWFIVNTASDDEDPSGASGWSISNDSRWRGATSTGGWATFGPSRIISVAGHAIQPANENPATQRPDPPNLARNPVQWSPQGGMQELPTTIDEISANEPSGATGSLDLAGVSASVAPQRRPHSKGFYLTTRVFNPAEQPALVQRPGGRWSISVNGTRYRLPSGSQLLLVKLWHVYFDPGRGSNTIELLGEVFRPRPTDRLLAPVEVCLPAPRGVNSDRLGLAVKGRLDPHWTILATTLKDDLVCAWTTRVAWMTLVLAPEDEAA